MMNKYYKNNSMEMPHKMLVNFIDNNPDVKTVIDLGCGAGKDSRFLAKRNIKVTAIDRVDVTNFLYNGLEENERENINFIQSKFSEAELPKSDMVISYDALPFVKKEVLPEVIEKIYNSLEDGGYLLCDFWGKKDSWYGDEKTVFLEKEEIEELLKKFKILKLREVEQDGETALHLIKHWHTFWIVAKKI